MKAKFIFSYISRDSEGIYRDMTAESSAAIIDYLPSHREYDNALMRSLERLLLSNKLQKLPVSGLFQTMFGNLNNYDYCEDYQYFILIPSTSVGKLSLSYLKRFRKRHQNVRLFPVLTDSMHASSPHMIAVRPKLFWPVWEKVLTFDQNDADEFGFLWFGLSWYSAFDEIRPSENECDLFYIGYKKGDRESIIADLYDSARAHDIRCDFRVISNSESVVKEGSSLRYETRRYRYPEVVSSIKSANCLLEVLQKGQKTQSIKYYESVCYDKKLLTNNKDVVNLPYYDPDCMKVFESMDDIDWEWIKDNKEISYHYANEFSPLGIVDYLKHVYNLE